MSGTMKIFFDRLSDLLYKHKDWGRKLRGKSLACLSVSNSDDIEDSFYKAFRLSADYLGMTYLGQHHAWRAHQAISSEVKNGLDDFAKQVVISSV